MRGVRIWSAAGTVTVVAAAAALGIAGPTVAAPRIAGDGLVAPDAAIVPGEAIVRFETGTTAGERRSARAAADVSLDRGLRLAQTQVVEVDGSVAAAVRRLERQPDVAFAQPNYRYRALAQAPDDSFFGDLWGMSDSALPSPGVGALAAWDSTRGAGQVIAVVDTGVDLTHPDLAPNLWSNPGEAQNGLDDDGNGRVDDVRGYDFVDGDGQPDDYNFHGTHVAGTAAAVAGNALGVAGVAPQARIMAVRVLDGDGSGDTGAVADGILYAAAEGADVINLSLGGPAGASDTLLSQAVGEAGARGTVVVAAAGNDAVDNDVQPSTPCTLPQAHLICVAATTQAGALAGFSNYGATTVDVGAPGAAILSAKPDYGQLLAAGFDGSATGWVTSAFNGGVAWELSTTRPVGTHSAADSPAGDYGAATDPSDFAASELYTAAPVDLGGRRGCRMHYRSLYEIEDPDVDGTIFDALVVGAVADADSSVFDGLAFAGESPGYGSSSFGRDEVSISDLDGRSDAIPIFSLLSDGSVQRDGAYVDDLRLVCRDSSYADAKTTVAAYVDPGAGNYVEFNGTSMATPHVAGVAALVRAAVPSATPAEVAEAIRSGAAPLPALAGKTVSGGTADAPAAIAAAGGIVANRPLPPVSAPPPPTPTRPAKPRLTVRGLRVSRRGRFVYRFRAPAGVTGRAVFRTRRKAVIGARRAHLTIASRRFATRSGGRVALRIKLSPRERRILRRNRRLLLTVTVAVRTVAGLSARASAPLTLKPPRRR
jgi:thermitase